MHAPVDESLGELTVAITPITAGSASFSALQNSFDALADDLERDSLSPLRVEIRANRIAECNPVESRFIRAVRQKSFGFGEQRLVLFFVRHSHALFEKKASPEAPEKSGR